MVRRRAKIPEDVPELIRQLRALDVYKTGTSLAARAADALEAQAGEIARLAGLLKALKVSD